MELTKEQRRAMLAMYCIVARADGEVSSGEYEALLDLLTRVANGAVGFSELDQWMHKGPPAFEVRMPESYIRTFLREALALARVDGTMQDVELATIKDLVTKYFEAPTTVEKAG
jgi:tellurite resistance protein